MKKLIELDAAIKETWKDTGYTDPLNVMTAIRDRLEALPTVDAVPVVHGRWVTDGMMMDCGEYLMTRCTACGTPFEYGYDMPYCPQCGAKMDCKDGDGNDS